MGYVYTRRTLFDVLQENGSDKPLDVLTKCVIDRTGLVELPAITLGKIRKFIYDVEVRWRKANRHRMRFLQDNEAWLLKEVNLGIVYSPKPAGRPQKAFEECAPKVQARKIKHLVESKSSDELAKATEVKLRKAGKRDSAAIVKELCSSSRTRGTKIKKARKSSLEVPAKLSANEALALIVDANLSTNQYNLVRDQAREAHCKMYPSYYKVKNAKTLCYPDGITITETSADVRVQSLLDHTVTRLAQAQEDVFRSLSDVSNINLVVKWGCDGAQQNMYRQKFSDVQSTDQSLFSVSMVPIQLYNVNNNCKSIIWQNPAPSSTRFCRPIRFVFAKESPDLVQSEVQKVDEQIANLSPTRVTLGDKEFVINPHMIFCMIDGKVCNSVSSCASTQTCYLCKAKPKEMNDLQVLSQKIVNRDFLSFGLSPLHSWIRFCECILHISYRLDIKSWQVRGAENRTKMEEKKKHVQEQFRSELGLLIDMPQQQAGNTNDGNTARKFFRNAAKSSEITGVNLELIERFHIILECLNCGFPIDEDKFGLYTRSTLDLYLKHYSWYYMPVSVHKVLYHGKDIISSSILPIGQLSEEAQEARNKDARKYRELFTRKSSRVNTNTDLMHRLLITSDPYISSLRAPAKTKRSKITPEVLQLLREPSFTDTQSESSDSD